MDDLKKAVKQSASNAEAGVHQIRKKGKEVVTGTGRAGQKVGKGVMDVAGTGFETVKGFGKEAADAAQSALRELGLRTGGRRSRRRSKSRKSRHNRRRTRHSRRRRSSSRRRRSHTRRRR